MSRPQDVVTTPAPGLTRRELVRTLGAGAGALALGASAAGAQTPAGGPVAPPSTVTSPPRDFGPNGAPNVYFWDPDVIDVDPSFKGLAQPNAPIQRLWTGALWSEGPAWNAQGRYLVWSDIPNNRQLRWLEDDGRVSVMLDQDKTVRVDVCQRLLASLEEPVPTTRAQFTKRLLRYRSRFAQIASAKYDEGQFDLEVNVFVVRITALDLG